MTEQEVKKEIGEQNWEEFCKWMGCQTVRINTDGSTDFYKCDVEAFKRKLLSGYDRQKSPEWD